MADLPRRSSTLLVSVFVILTVGLLFASTLIYTGYRRHYRTEVERLLSAIAELKVDELQHWRRERLGDADIILNNNRVRGLLQHYLKKPTDRHTAGEITNFLAQFPGHYDYDEVHLLNSKGLTHLSVPTGSQPASGLLKSIREVTESKKVAFVDFYRDASDERIHLGVLIPIIDGGTGAPVIGFVFLRIDPEKNLYPIILRWPTPSETAETFLVRRDGENVLFLNELKNLKNTALRFRLPLERTDAPSVMAVLGRTGIVEGIDYRGAPTLADIRPVPNSPWYLVARLMTSEVYAAMGPYLWLIGGFAFALILGSAAVLVFLWRKQSINFYRKQAATAEALRENSEVYQAILATTSDGFWLTDIHGKLVNVNDTYARLSGYSVAELLHMQVIDLEAEASTKTSILARIQHPSETRIELFESLHRRKNGSTWPVEVSCSYRPGGDGPFIVFLRDITVRKQTEQALIEAKNSAEEASKNKTKFLDIAAHELRTPVTAFSLLLQLAQKQVAKGQTLSSTTLTKLQELADRLKRLVLDLLDLSRVERGLMVLHPTRTNIVSLVSVCVVEFQTRFPHRGITFSGPEDLVELEIDPVKINQVLSNLLDNAVKYTGHDRPIEITVDAMPQLIRVSVIDHGEGIPKEQLSNLFTAFSRGSGESVVQAGGLGLGLAVCREIIGLHGGTVGVQSEVGHGCTFYFELPRKNT